MANVYDKLATYGAINLTYKDSGRKRKKRKKPYNKPSQKRNISGNKTYFNSDGYQLIKDNNKYKLLHRERVGDFEKLQKGWEVHHCDRNRKNNSIENLVQIPKSLHRKIHYYFKDIKRMPTKNIIETIYLPEYLDGHSTSLNCHGEKELKRYLESLERKRLGKINPHTCSTTEYQELKDKGLVKNKVILR